MHLALSIDSCIHLTLSSYMDNKLFFGREVGGDGGWWFRVGAEMPQRPKRRKLE